jgi:hypothetical protein
MQVCQSQWPNAYRLHQLSCVSVAITRHTVLPSKSGGVCIDWDETQSVREDFILNYGGVVVHVHSFDRHGRDFGQEYPSVGICDRRIHSYEIKLHLKVVQLMNLHA